MASNFFQKKKGTPSYAFKLETYPTRAAITTILISRLQSFSPFSPPIKLRNFRFIMVIIGPISGPYNTVSVGVVAAAVSLWGCCAFLPNLSGALPFFVASCGAQPQGGYEWAEVIFLYHGSTC
jgi:hypothetical protein